MANNPSNLYAVPSLPNLDPQAKRVIEDLAARVNYLTTELDRVRGSMPDPGAQKERPIPGIITIPPTGTLGQSGSVRVNQDGVIVSYVNPNGSFPYLGNMFLDYTTTTTVANTTTETQLLGNGDDGSTRIVDTSIVKIGRTFRVSFRGTFAFTATPTISIKLKLGGVTIQDFTPLTTLMTGTGSEWLVDEYITISAIGSSGQVFGHVSQLYHETSEAGAQGKVLTSGRGKTTPTVDLSVAQPFTLTMTWGTANAANTLTYNFGCIDIVR